MAAFDIGRVRARFPGREIAWRERTTSTMDDAAALAEAGAPPGSAAVGEEQTAGQGRLGRAWHSEPGAGLYVSLVLEARGITPALTLALGLATAEAAARAAGVVCDLRWPNDVLIGGRKCAGILVQLHGEAAIAGIGVNVNHAHFPEELADKATSLRMATGREHAREDVLIELLGVVDRYLEIMRRQGPGAVLDLFERASSYARGRRVTVDRDGEVLAGTTDGLDQAGFLWLRTGDGKRRLILSGGVRPL